MIPSIFELLILIVIRSLDFAIQQQPN